MAYKEREKPRMLCIYEALAKRMKLGPADQYYLLHMDGGFVGECGLDVHTDALDSRCLVRVLTGGVRVIALFPSFG